MADQFIEWIKVADFTDALAFNAEQIAVVTARGQFYCIGRYREQLFGFAYRCPHAAVPLSDGYIDSRGNIVCPLHAYKFSLLNGRNVSGEGYFLKTWPVESRPDGVYLGLPAATPDNPNVAAPCH
jgi:3-phenylpropionate/trans-cinnamate dioxygenase ferredoxin subunit